MIISFLFFFSAGVSPTPDLENSARWGNNPMCVEGKRIDVTQRGESQDPRERDTVPVSGISSITLWHGRAVRSRLSLLEVSSCVIHHRETQMTLGTWVEGSLGWAGPDTSGASSHPGLPVTAILCTKFCGQHCPLRQLPIASEGLRLRLPYHTVTPYTCGIHQCSHI